MISVTLREIEKSFRRHRNVVESSRVVNGAHRMVLFYAVECGLKALYMRKNRLGRTGPAITDFGHRLTDLITELRCRHGLPDCAAKNGRSIAVKSLHEAWRYGKSLDYTKEAACETALRRIMQWITIELEVGI